MHSPNSLFTGNIYEGKEPYAFISYSHKDSGDVLPIVSDLNSKGLRVWYDEGIEAGSEWPEYLAEHLANSSVVVAFISGNFNDSKYCRREMHFATRLNKPIICIYIDNAKLSYGLEMELTAVQGFKKENYVSNVELVQSVVSVRVISTILVKEPEPQPVQAAPVQSPAPQPVAAVPQQIPNQQPAAVPVQAPVPQPVATVPVQTPAPQPVAAPVNKPVEKTVKKPANAKQPKPKRKFSRKALIITLSVGIPAFLISLIICIAVAAIVSVSNSISRAKNISTTTTTVAQTSSQTDSSQSINNDALKKLVNLSGTKFSGNITPNMLRGYYTNLYLNDKTIQGKTAKSLLKKQYPNMKYVERMADPRTGTAARTIATSVPYRFRCDRLINHSDVKTPNKLDLDNYDLDTDAGWQKLFDELQRFLTTKTAEQYYANYMKMYNTFFISMYFYQEDGSIASGSYNYILTIDQNVMHCTRFDIGEDNEIIDYNSEETYSIGFVDNILVIESNDKSRIELMPEDQCYFMNGNTNYFYRYGFLLNTDNAYKNISRFIINLELGSDKKSIVPTVIIEFINGGKTRDAKVTLNSGGNLTISWYAVYHPDTNTTDAEPDVVTIRLIGNYQLCIIDENDKVYDYSARTEKTYQEQIA